MTGSVLIVPIFLDNDTKNEFYFPLWIFFVFLDFPQCTYVTLGKMQYVLLLKERRKENWV